METRPSEESRLQTIHVAALEAFMRDGYAGTSMSSIARAVGGSKTTLYSRYESKKELFLDVVRIELDRFFAALSRLTPSGMSIEAALRRHCIEFAKAAQSEDVKGVFRLVISECNRIPEIQADYMARVKNHLAQLSAEIEAHVGKVQGLALDWQAAAKLLFDLDMNFLYQQLQDGDGAKSNPSSPEDHADAVLGILLPPLTWALGSR